jgi:hypothetical protein
MQKPHVGVFGETEPTVSRKRCAKEQPKKMWLAVKRGFRQMGKNASVADKMFFRKRAALDCTGALVSSQAKNYTFEGAEFFQTKS